MAEQTSWTATDKWKARVSPFLVMKKLDQIIEERLAVDEAGTWEKALSSPPEQEAAIRLAQKEVARIERLEDKLNRQQPLATLLTSLSAGLLVAAWLRAEWVVVTLTLIALGIAAVALVTSSRANHFFEEHTLTPPELQEITSQSGTSGSTIAARAVIDTQRNLPYQSQIGNRNEAVRRALNAAIGTIVIAALVFAIPNWGSEKAPPMNQVAQLEGSLNELRDHVRDLRIQSRADQRSNRRLRRNLEEFRKEMQRLLQ